MYVIILGVFIFSVAAMRITIYFELEKWQTSLGCILFAVVLYFINNFLIQHYIKQRKPDFNSNEEIISGIKKWELTSGLGIVPKWVSLIGLLSVSSLITAFLPWIFFLIKKVINIF